MSEAHICVGVIAGAFGTDGEVRLKSFCAEPDAIAEYGALTSEDGSLAYDVTLDRPIKNGFAARLTGVKTKEDADALRGQKLYVHRDMLPGLPDDEFYHSDLEGLAVFDTGGTSLGTVKSVLNHGAGDLLEVQENGRSETVLVPFTKDGVPTVDLAKGRVIVDPPAGLFSDG